MVSSTSTSGESSKTHKELILQHVPLWFGAVFAFVYITGYFVDFFQHSAHGMVDSGEDILKLRYIQVGINFFILFSAVVAPVFFLLFGRKRMQPIGRHPDNLPAITATASFAAVAYFLTIYYAAIFTPPGYFYSDFLRLCLLFFFAISVPLAAVILIWLVPLLRAQGIERRQHPPETKTHAFHKLNRDKDLYYKWFTRGILIYSLAFFVILFYKMIPDMLEMFPFGLFFFLYCFLFTLIAYRMVLRLDGGMPHLTQFARFGYVTMFVLMLIVVFYLAVASYAYAIFPHIPALKGGAHYLSSPVVSVKLRPAFSEEGTTLPVKDPELSSMVVIYSSSNSIYVANACDWRRDKRTAPITQVNRRFLRYVVVNPGKPIKDLTDCLPEK